MKKYRVGDVQTYIYKCRKCKNVYTLNFTVIAVHAYGPVVKLGSPIVEPCPVTNPFNHRTCPKCGSFSDTKMVKGHITDTPCDHRCTSAKGPNCDCSCGGKNHGSDYRPV